MSDWREVSKGEFYAGIGQQNVHPKVIGTWPYTSEYVTPYGEVRGRVVDSVPEGQALAESRYFLPAIDAMAAGEDA